MDKTFFEKNTLLYSILLQSAEMNVHMAQETLRTSESNTELQNTYTEAQITIYGPWIMDYIELQKGIVSGDYRPVTRNLQRGGGTQVKNRIDR